MDDSAPNNWEKNLTLQTFYISSPFGHFDLFQAHFWQTHDFNRFITFPFLWPYFKDIARKMWMSYKLTNEETIFLIEKYLFFFWPFYGHLGYFGHFKDIQNIHPHTHKWLLRYAPYQSWSCVLAYYGHNSKNGEIREIFYVFCQTQPIP